MSGDHDDVKIAKGNIDRAEALIDLGRYDQAIPLLSRSLASSPDDDSLHCRLADVYFYIDDFSRSEKHAKTALHLNPESDHAHFRLAWIHLKTHNFRDALLHAKQAISLYPDDEPNLYTLAWAEYHSGHYVEALAAAESALKLNPVNADLHELMGDLLFNMDKKKEAEKHYREALKNQPDDAGIHCSLGECLSSQYKIYEASEHMLAAVRIDPGNKHYSNKLFHIVHHEIMNMPLESQDSALSKLDPSVQSFYKDKLTRGGTMNSLRVTSIATLWLLALSLLMLFFLLITGESVKQLSMFIIVVVAAYAALYIGRLIAQYRAVKHNNNRQ